MRIAMFLSSALCWPGMSTLVKLPLSRNQPCARSTEDASWQRWVAFKILGSSLIPASDSIWMLFQLFYALIPQPQDYSKFFFLPAMLWEWNPLLKCQAMRNCRDKDLIHGRILPSSQLASNVFNWAFQQLW